MKTISHIISIAIAVAALCACSPDPASPEANGDNRVVVQVGISTTPSPTSRAADEGEEWNDRNATKGELMRNCFVVAVQAGKIAAIMVSDDYAEEKSHASRMAMRLQTGTTTFYSFANIRPTDLGIDPDNCVGKDAPDLDNATYAALGNVDDIADFAQGIPMSGRKTVDITENTQQIDLEVTRLVAKVRISLTNDTNADIVVKSISISDITDNGDNRLRLLPATDADGNTQPAITPTATRSTRTVSLGEGRTVKAGTSQATDVTFYINESVAQTPKYFVVNIETTQTNVSHRVAMLKWSTIARGDYLLLPIRLNDYRITYDVEQFTAIGVLPDVENDRDMLTVRFHSYGDFHMRPHVIRLSDGKELTPGTSLADGWTLESWDVLEMMPEGPEGTCIYDSMPYADHTRRTFEGSVGNRKGYALHQVLFRVGGTDYAIPYRVQIIRE